MSAAPDAALDVFFSYSHRDEALRDELEKHLARLKRDGAIRTWHDRRIGAGREWEGEIDAHLASAHLVLLLISADFLDSDYCFEIEMKRALERHEAGEGRVVPILLRPADWQTGRLAALQALPPDGRPVTQWDDRDAAWLAVTQGIRSALDELRPRDATDEEPKYSDEKTRGLSEALDDAYRREEDLLSRDMDTAAVRAEILGLRRRIREGGQLKAGDFLLDGRFRLLEPIGRGGFANVWKAMDRTGRDLVAVKVLHGQYAEDRSRRERFFRGARKMARLQHQGIVRVIEQECEDGGDYFFVMEHVSGGDFRRAILEGRLSAEERLRVVLGTGEALDFAHREGLVHRDVKPANILLDEDNRPKLTDFDLVRAADTTGGTRTSMLGTFLYAAPEAMLNAKEAAEPADVYGLGMTAIFAIHGADLPADVLWELPELLETLAVSERCRDVLARAVRRKSDQRWSSVREFCNALDESSVDGEVSEERRPPRKKGPPSELVELPPPAEGERLNSKDRSVLVRVPGGKYTLGSDPPHEVDLSPFWIGKYPVTNQQYRRFLEANPDQAQPEYWSDEDFNDPLQPVVGVSWKEALAYCRWAGGSLPSEAQWEAAARGNESRSYPWGDQEPHGALANFDENVGRTTAVGSYPEGVGPFGTHDQAGNVWEWCLDQWDPNAYETCEGERDPVAAGYEANDDALRVVRGGSWFFPAGTLPAAVRYRSGAGERDKYLGFRVVCRSGPEHGD